MIWHVEGADSTSGANVSTKIEAADKEAALKIAKSKGIFTSNIYPMPSADQVSNPKIQPMQSTNQATKAVIQSPRGWIFIAIVVSIFLVVATAVITVVVLRQPKPPQSVKNSPAEPLSSFKSYCERLLPHLQKRFSDAGTFGTGNYARTTTIDSKYSLDVLKTESLVSPYIGVVHFQQRIRIAYFGNDASDYALVLTFGLQDGTWALTSAVDESAKEGGADLMKAQNREAEARAVMQAISETDASQ